MTNDLLETYYNIINNIERVPLSNDKKIKTEKKAPKKSTSIYYENYRKKLENNQFDKFGTRDFLYFFKDTANDVGVKYVISNYAKDMRVFKLLKERGYSNEEILIMIEFLFKSDQDYLDKRYIQPTVLISGWCNKIYQDSQLWLNDKYVPKSKAKFSQREYTGDTNITSISIGEWDI